MIRFVVALNQPSMYKEYLRAIISLNALGTSLMIFIRDYTASWLQRAGVPMDEQQSRALSNVHVPFGIPLNIGSANSHETLSTNPNTDNTNLIIHGISNVQVLSASRGIGSADSDKTSSCVIGVINKVSDVQVLTASR